MSTKKELSKQSFDLSPSDFLDLHISIPGWEIIKYLLTRLRKFLSDNKLLVVSYWFQTANQQPKTNNQKLLINSHINFKNKH